MSPMWKRKYLCEEEECISRGRESILRGRGMYLERERNVSCEEEEGISCKKGRLPSDVENCVYAFWLRNAFVIQFSYSLVLLRQFYEIVYIRPAFFINFKNNTY